MATESGDHGKWGRDAVRALRKRLDLTQEDFANLVGVRAQTVNRWERGRAKPQRLAAAKLDEVAGQNTSNGGTANG